MDQNKAKVYTLLGFAQKAGKLISGTNTIETMLGKPEAKLLILAEDGSSSFINNITHKCQNQKQRYINFGTKDELGNAIGKSQRVAIIVKDGNIARAILDILK